MTSRILLCAAAAFALAGCAIHSHSACNCCTGAAHPAALSPADRAALLEALDDERHAAAECRAVLARFGAVAPFTDTADAESRHAQELTALFDRYQLRLPPDPWAAAAIPPPRTLPGACRRGVESELRNIAMYDRLIPTVQEPDIRAAFQQLRDESWDRRLPAFERLAGAD